VQLHQLQCLLPEPPKDGLQLRSEALADPQAELQPLLHLLVQQLLQPGQLRLLRLLLAPVAAAAACPMLQVQLQVGC
jgi:hypothetical protein